MNVLIGEDNDVFQKIYTLILGRLNCNTIMMNNCKEVVDYLANPANPRPRIIILKNQSRVMSGPEASCILRTDPMFAMDPILRATPILGSNPYIEGDYERCIYMDDVIPRTTNTKRLAKVLQYWLRRELAPPGSGPGPGMAFRPVWGPFPLRAYRGPRSPL